MKTPFSFLALFLCFSLSVFSQKFNRSITDFTSSVQEVFLQDGNLYTIEHAGYRAISKYDVSGNLVKRSIWNADSLLYIPEEISKESDTSFVVSGFAVDSSFASIYQYGFVSRVDTSLNILDIRVLNDTSVELHTWVTKMPNNHWLTVRSFSTFFMDENFNTIKYYYKPNVDSRAAVYLGRDSVLIQRLDNGSWDFVVIDMGDSTEVNVNGTFGIKLQHSYSSFDYNDTSICVLHRTANNASELLFYDKMSLSLQHKVNVDSIAGFPVLNIRNTYNSGVIAMSNDGRYAVIDGEYPFALKMMDTVRTALGSTHGYWPRYMDGNYIALSSKAKTCQTHLEVFPINDKAPTFGEIGVNASLISSKISGHADNVGSSSSPLYAYRILFSAEVWIKNSSNNFLDSTTLYYHQGGNNCNSHSKINVPNANLAVGDSMMVAINDSSYFYTNDSNIVNLKLIVEPIMANGNIVYPAKADTIKYEFKGMSLRETKFVNQLEVYPSPARDELNVNITGSGIIDRVMIYSITGQQVLSKEISDTKAELNVSKLKNGIYILSTSVNGEIQSQRFSKQ